MAEYIDRLDAYLAIGAQVKEGRNKVNEGLAAAIDAIGALPAADVAPVRHGRDIYDTVIGHCEFKCSVCGTELSTVYGGQNDFGMDGGYFNYCPNCGAKMDQEEEQ